MTRTALRILSAGIAITTIAISLAAGKAGQPRATLDPSVPPASEVFRANDGRGEGNVEDKTY